MSATDAATLRARYAASRVTYLLGADDTDPADSSLDLGCAAEIQGVNRLERGRAYLEHLGDSLSAEVYQRQMKVVVPGVGHTAHGMFTSPEGQVSLFS